MTIALIGASGNAGSRILKELSDRGHHVTAIARHLDRIPSLPNVTARQANVFDREGLAALLKGHEAAISAVHFTASDPGILIEAVKAAGVPRYLVVGGAGSLEVAPGVRVVDTPDFPAVYKAEALKGAEFLEPSAGTGPGLDLPFALGAFRAGPAHRPSGWAGTSCWYPTRAAASPLKISP